ncbi:MAG: hypothetical protein Q9160_008611 [Pyrenula sp. 1 TL-2023]
MESHANGDMVGVSLVAGAGSGIGRVLAQSLVARGATNLICADLIIESAQETAQLCRSIGRNCSVESVQVDVRDEQSVQRMVDQAKAFGGCIDYFMTTARIMLEHEPRQVPAFGRTLRTSARHMIKGSIVVLTSLASEGAFTGVGNYVAAKHAVKGLVQTAALENARKGIRVNAVAPSYVSGPMMNQFLESAPDLKATMFGDLPLGRLVDPEEVADAVLFLASSSGSYINGQTLVKNAFARYRNSLGLPAISIGYGMIAEVGYLHEHPEIEFLLKRKGIRPINEDEMLQILANQNPKNWQLNYNQLASSHLLTGIEFTGLQEQRDQGFEGDNHVPTDPRASHLAAALERNSAGGAGDVNAALSVQGLPDEVARILMNGGGLATNVLEAIRAVVTKKIANLILLPIEKIRPEQKLADFGLDSVLAAEFRTYVFRTLGVDVPFMMLLEKSTTINMLAESINTGLAQCDRH